MKIDFLGLGVQKGGTTTLHDILKQHSKIFLPEKKEAHFFDYIERYNKGISWLQDTFFPDMPEGRKVGKFTPDYIYIKETPERIAETLGKDIKFIVVFRHPVDRAVSNYNMNYRRGIDELSFFDAIAQEQTRITNSEASNHNYSYNSRGYYSEQVKRYLEIFPPENFMFLIFETDIVNNIGETISKIQNFLGVEQEDLDCNIKSNEAFIPYSIKLNRLIRKNEKIKALGKVLFPLRVRKYLKNIVFNLNNKPGTKPLFKLAKEERERLFTEFFYHDVKQLEKLIKTDLNNVWYKE